MRRQDANAVSKANAREVVKELFSKLEPKHL